MTESRLPKCVYDNPKDMNNVSDSECSLFIENNWKVWERLSPAERLGIAKWWESEWDQAWEELKSYAGGDVITDTELVQYLTEEGYLLKK